TASSRPPAAQSLSPNKRAHCANASVPSTAMRANHRAMPSLPATVRGPGRSLRLGLPCPRQANTRQPRSAACLWCSLRSAAARLLAEVLLRHRVCVRRTGGRHLAADPSSLRVVGAERGISDGQRALLKRTDVSVPPQLAVGEGEVAQQQGGIGVFGAQGGLSDRNSTLLKWQRLVVAPHSAVH